MTEDGLGTIYNPSGLSERLSRKRDEELPPLTKQWLPSLDIHEVHYKGDRAGATVLRQGPIESSQLNTVKGLMYYKGLTREEAEQVIHSREQIGDVACSTMLLRLRGTDLKKMEKHPMPVPLDRFAYLAEDVVYSLERLIRSQGVIA